MGEHEREHDEPTEPPAEADAEPLEEEGRGARDQASGAAGNAD